MPPNELIDIARSLVAAPREPASQARLRRAVSTTYYALFHALCEAAADALVGARDEAAWLRVYRAANHGTARRACTNREVLARLTPDLQRFADLFSTLQTRRQDADYDPTSVFEISDVLEAISATEVAVAALAAAPPVERRALAAAVLFERRA